MPITVDLGNGRFKFIDDAVAGNAPRPYAGEENYTRYDQSNVPDALRPLLGPGVDTTLPTSGPPPAVPASPGWDLRNPGVSGPMSMGQPAFSNQGLPAGANAPAGAPMPASSGLNTQNIDWQSTARPDPRPPGWGQEPGQFPQPPSYSPDAPTPAGFSRQGYSPRPYDPPLAPSNPTPAGFSRQGYPPPTQEPRAALRPGRAYDPSFVAPPPTRQWGDAYTMQEQATYTPPPAMADRLRPPAPQAVYARSEVIPNLAPLPVGSNQVEYNYFRPDTGAAPIGASGNVSGQTVASPAMAAPAQAQGGTPPVRIQNADGSWTLYDPATRQWQTVMP